MVTKDENEILVTVGIITKNEEAHIRETIQSVLNSYYPKNKYEVLIVDGNSIDGTQNIIKDLQNSNKNIKLILEPWQKGSHGMARNLLIDNAKGKYVAFTDGDCIVGRDWLSMLFKTIIYERERDFGVVAVGGIRYPVKTKNWKENLLNNILGTYFGSGGSQGFVKTKKKYTDSVPNYNSIYVKDIIKKERYSDIGIGEDYELNLRLNKKGYKIIFTDKAQIYHHQENSIFKFLGQIYRYGKAQPKIYRKIKKIRFFAIVSPLFVLGLFLGLILSYFSPVFKFFYLTGIITYLSIDLFYTLLVSLRINKIYSLLSLIIYPLMHVFYGLGVIRGYLDNSAEEIRNKYERL